MEASTTATIGPVERVRLEAAPAAEPIQPTDRVRTGPVRAGDADGGWAELLAPEAPAGRPSAPWLARLAKRVRPAERDFLVDAAMLGLAALAAAITAPGAGVPVEGAGWLMAAPLLTLALLAKRGIYGRHGGPRLLEDVRTIVGAVAVAAMAVTFVP